MMTKLFYASDVHVPEDVISHLADGERHWRKGFSAYELSHSWVRADGFPAPVSDVLDGCESYRDAELVEGFFEKEVDLRTRGRASQTDLMVFAKVADRYAVVAVEGKVDEPFGPLVGDWNDGSAGRMARLEALCQTLGLNVTAVEHLRYQLFHRTASAIYEAQRYRCGRALMLVHSFSETDASFDDFVKFASSMGTPVHRPNSVSPPKMCEGIELRLVWVKDEPLGQHGQPSDQGEPTGIDENASLLTEVL